MNPDAPARYPAPVASRAPIWHSAVIFGISFAFLFVTMGLGVNVYDEGLIVFGAMRVMNGDVPYRDFYANYGPAQFYVLAGLFKVFGPSILIGRIWDTFVRAAIVAIIYAIFARMESPRMGMIAATASALWLSAFGVYGYPVYPCLLMTVLSIYFVLPAYCREGGRVTLLIAGGCIGVAALFRPDVGAIAAISHMTALTLFQVKARLDGVERSPKLIPAVAIFSAGVLLVAVPLWLSVMVIASPTEVLRDLVIIPMETYGRMRSLPFKWNSVNDWGVFLPPVVGLMGIAIALNFGGRASTNAKAATATMQCIRYGALLLVACCALFFTLKGVLRISLRHLAIALVPSLLTACLVWLLAPGSRHGRIMALLLVVPMALVSIGAAMLDYTTLMINKEWIFNSANVGDKCHPAAGLERLGCFKADQDQLAAIRFVQERTADDERIFVGLESHDRIFVNDVLFYFLAKRLSATKWHHFDPGVQTTREIQTEMVRELEAVKPKVVVLRSDWSRVREPNESSISSGVSVLNDFIGAHYVLAATFSSIQVYELHREAPFS